MFSNDQVKTKPSLTSDIRFQYTPDSFTDNKADNFYSNSLRAISDINMGIATADQWKKMLLNNGASEAELKWIGFDDFLSKNPKPTKNQVFNFIKENQVEVVDVVKGGVKRGMTASEARKALEEGNAVYYMEPDGGSEFEVYEIDESDSQERNYYLDSDFAEASSEPNKYSSQYQLPGGQNYKEMLLVMPSPKRFEELTIKSVKEGLNDSEKTELASYQGKQNSYKSSHWDEPNILAHIRMNEREVNGEKVLFIEEIQSDWAQDGRKKGFKDNLSDNQKIELTKLKSELQEIERRQIENDRNKADGYERIREELFYEFTATQSAIEKIEGGHMAVPNMPFPQTAQWVNLSLRRMIRYAAENGFDRVAWVNGEQSAERYNLSKSVKYIQKDTQTFRDGEKKTIVDVSTSNGMLNFDINPNDGTILRQSGNTNYGDFVGKNLEEVIGKEITKNILEAGESKRFEGLDLKVGGEGMKSFYDQIVPTQAKKVLAKIDKSVKVEPISLGLTLDSEMARQEQANQFVNVTESDVKAMEGKQLSFPITPIIRQTAIQEGMPMFQRVDTVQPSPIQMTKKWDRTIAKWQDSQIYMKRLIELKYPDAKIPDAINTYVLENLSKGRIREKHRKFHETHWTPLTEALIKLKNEGASYEESSRYLKAKHIVLDKIEEGGIPMAEAEQIVKEFEAKTKSSKELMDQIQRVNQFILDDNLESGIISKTKHDDLMKFYKFYVPLRGFNAADESDPTIFTREYKRKGRSSESGDPIAYLGAMSQTAIEKGERNRVLKSLYDFTVQNPDSRLYKIKNAYYLKDKETGKLQTVSYERPSAEEFERYDVSFTDPNIDDEASYQKYLEQTAFERENLTVKVNGKSVVIEFIGPEGKLVGDAIKKQSMDKVPKYLSLMNNYIALLRKFYTQYSPEFAIRNAIRDAFTGLINLRTDKGAKTALDVAVDIPRSAKTLAKWVRSGKFDETTKDGRLLKEFVETGGLTGYTTLTSVAEFKKELQRSIDGLQAELSAIQKVGGFLKDKTYKTLLDPLNKVNQVFENQVRFATYKNLREKKGYTPQQAAIYAKDLTVNFNRKGNISDLVGSFYLFFNASLQGVERTLRPFGNKETRGRAALQALVLLPAINIMLQTLSRSWWDEDEDGETPYDKLPDYIRTHNLIIPNFFGPEGSFLQIPLPYGFNVFFTWPETIMRAAAGKETVGDGVLKTFSLISESFSPLGAPDLKNLSADEAFWKYISPTVLDPAIDRWTNKNFMGLPIYKEPYPGQTPAPSSQQYFKSVNPIIRTMTDWMNQATGGDKVTSGAIDINPEIVEHYLGSWTGGAGSFIMNVGGTIATTAKGESPLSYETGTIRKFPFARNYTTAVPDQYYEAKFYELAEEIKTKSDLYERYRKNPSYREETKNYRMENKSMMAMEPQVKVFEKRIKEMRLKRDTYAAKGRTQEAEEMEQRMTETYIKFIQMHEQRLRNEVPEWLKVFGFK